MRRLLVAVGLLALAHAPARAQEDPYPIEFSARPCAELCAYATIPYSLGYQACEKPFPEGSYADVVTEPAPTPPQGMKMILRVEIKPTVDWDLFLCRLLAGGNHNGPQYPQGDDLYPPTCGNVGSIVPVGCLESYQLPAQAGTQYVIRGYNFADIAPCPGSYRWIFV